MAGDPVTSPGRRTESSLNLRSERVGVSLRHVRRPEASGAPSGRRARARRGRSWFRSSYKPRGTYAGLRPGFRGNDLDLNRHSPQLRPPVAPFFQSMCRRRVSGRPARIDLPAIARPTPANSSRPSQRLSVALDLNGNDSQKMRGPDIPTVCRAGSRPPTHGSGTGQSPRRRWLVPTANHLASVGPARRNPFQQAENRRIRFLRSKN